MDTPPNPQILDQALDAVEREAGLRVVVDKPTKAERGYDAAVRIDGTRWLVEVKKWAQHANLGALIDQIKKMPGPGMLVADFVNPRMAEKLRAHDVQFIDTAGNAFIHTPRTYIYIRGNRPQRAEKTGGERWRRKETYGRAFAPAGLKVVHALLCDPKLVNAPYREIAGTAGAAVGTVGWVLNDLKARRFIADLGQDHKKRIVDYRRLLDRWTEAYPEKLRPKQLLGVYEAENADWWKDIDIAEFDGYWGAETAAAKLKALLRPEVATVYLRAHGLARFAGANRLRKATQTHRFGTGSTVHVLETFWHGPEAYADLVDPVLIYADLIATADPRNREAAQVIFDEHIAGRIGKD